MFKALLSTLAVCCAAASSSAAVQFSDNGTPVVINHVGFAQGYPPNSFIIEHTSSASFGHVTIWCTGQDNLGRIICNNSATGQLLLVQIGLGNTSSGSWPGNIQSIEIEDTAFPGVRPVIISNMNTYGNVGSISVNRMLDTTIRGDVTGNMIFPLPLSGIDSNARSPAIENCTIKGDVLGSIEIESQIIDNLVVEGAFASPASPQHIFLDPGRAIKSSKFSEFHGVISTPTGGAIRAAADVSFTKEFGGTGAFTGEIRSHKPQEWPAVPGELDFQGPMSGSVRVSLGITASTGSIKLPGAAQFSGQIILNDSNTDPAWSGPVTVGGVPLTSGYAEHPSLLGGGSIGLVPFALHEEACSPTPGQSFSVVGAPSSFTLHHYGPVTFVGSSPLYIESKPIGCGAFAPIPETVTTTPHPTDPNAVILNTGPWLANGYEYRIKPELAGLEMLASDTLAAAAKPSVADYTYEFTVNCPGDVDNSGAVDVNDISYVLFRLGHTGCDADGDSDRSQSVDVNDISFILFRLGDNCAKYIPTN